MKIHTLQLGNGTVSIYGNGAGIYHNLASIYFDIGLVLDSLEEDRSGEVDLEGTIIGNYLKNMIQ